MKKNSYPGKFIVFEGLDGSGQSTQAGLFKKYLENKGFSVILTKEPTLDSKAGKKLRKILDKREKISPKQLQKLFFLDRQEHLKKKVIPALKKGSIVISDRHFFSSFAYGASEGIDLNWLIKLNYSFFLPDLTFLLKVRPRVCIERIEERGIAKTLFEKEQKLEAVWKTYKSLPQRFKNVYIILGERSIPLVFESIKKTFNSMNIKNKKPLNKYIDQTNIRTSSQAKDIIKTCQEALKYDFRGVCVNIGWIRLVKDTLKGSDIKVISLIDPPIGDSSYLERLRLCKQAKNDGADEIDVVMSLNDIKHEKWDKILKELKEICQVLPTKVIIGSGYLTDEEIEKASETVVRSKAICVKTATAKDPLENRELTEKARHLKLMKQGAPGLLIKASGSIKTFKDAKKMIEAGANIIGTSSGVEIMKNSK